MTANQTDDRRVCTSANPYTPDSPLEERWTHPAAVDDGECADSCCDFYKCPNCGLRFRCEVSQ